MTKSNFGRTWRPSIFITCFLLTGILAVSFLVQPMSDVWKSVDEAAFFALNGSLEWGGGWTFVWGHLNTRVLDVTWAVVMALPLFWVLLLDRTQPADLRFASVFIIVLSVLLGIMIGKWGFNAFERNSPSRVLTPFFDINQLIPGIKAKTGSGSSFPGDHGVAAIIYAVTIIAVFKRTSLTIIALFIAVMNMLPRLIGGGHWLSDVIVGGGGIACVVIPFTLATPSLNHAEIMMGHFLNKVLRPLFSKIGLSKLLD